MKVKILGKYIGKTGIESLLVTTESRDDANKMAVKASEAGATKDQILNFITTKEYQGVLGYSFFINCSNFTFERVGKFGILDCEIICAISAKGFLNAKIQIIDRKEQVFRYEASDEADGWATQTPVPEPVKVEPMGDGSHAEPNPIVDFAKLAADAPEAATDLPF